MFVIDRYRTRDFIGNYIAVDSRFGKLNPFSLIEYPRSYPLIYNDRIYYLKDEEERDFVMRNPKSLLQNDAIPQDVKSTPIIFLMGKTKSGKSTLAESIRDKFGFKVISIEEIMTDFIKQHEDSEIRSILHDVQNGKCLSD